MKSYMADQNQPLKGSHEKRPKTVGKQREEEEQAFESDIYKENTDLYAPPSMRNHQGAYKPS